MDIYPSVIIVAPKQDEGQYWGQVLEKVRPGLAVVRVQTLSHVLELVSSGNLGRHRILIHLWEDMPNFVNDATWAMHQNILTVRLMSQGRDWARLQRVAAARTLEEIGWRTCLRDPKDIVDTVDRLLGKRSRVFPQGYEPQNAGAFWKLGPEAVPYDLSIFSGRLKIEMGDSNYDDGIGTLIYAATQTGSWVAATCGAHARLGNGDPLSTQIYLCNLAFDGYLEIVWHPTLMVPGFYPSVRLLRYIAEANDINLSGRA